MMDALLLISIGCISFTLCPSIVSKHIEMFLTVLSLGWSCWRSYGWHHGYRWAQVHLTTSCKLDSVNISGRQLGYPSSTAGLTSDTACSSWWFTPSILFTTVAVVLVVTFPRVESTAGSLLLLKYQTDHFSFYTYFHKFIFWLRREKMKIKNKCLLLLYIRLALYLES